MGETDFALLGYGTAFTYIGGNDIIRQEDSLGRTTLYACDILHNLTEFTDPEGGVTKYEYDTRRNPISVTDALDQTWIYGYDKNYNTVFLTDPKGNFCGYTYDLENNLTTLTHIAGDMDIYLKGGGWESGWKTFYPHQIIKRDGEKRQLLSWP